jgi:alkylation response protein AidB-like acyl-CoA dehydrogenase
LFLVSHAGVPLGLARSALDFVEELATRKDIMPGRPMRDDAQVQETIASAEATAEAARCYVYRTLEDLWATLCAGERLSTRQRAHYRLMMTHAHQTAKNVINTLYDLAATSAIFRTSRLERNMRDILTSSQHRVVHPKMYRPAGRLILGLDPEELFF